MYRFSKFCGTSKLHTLLLCWRNIFFFFFVMIGDLETFWLCKVLFWFSFSTQTLSLQGGRHVDYVADQVIAKLIETVKKKNKGGVNIKPFQVGYSSYKTTENIKTKAVVFRLFQKTVILPPNLVGFRLTYTHLWDIFFIRYVSICLN